MKKKQYWFIFLVAYLFIINTTYAQFPGQRKIVIRTLPMDSISMSDPFVIADPVTRMYYMTGTGGMMWKSPDLKMWTGPYKVVDIETNTWMGDHPMIWAAEIYFYKGKYYYFATFTNSKTIIEKIPNRCDIQRRASHILVSDHVEGPYKLMNNNLYLPADQSTLDATFWVENGIPYMVYCHEWMQITDGNMDMIRLSDDMTAAAGEHKVLFKASEAYWAREMNSIGEVTFGMKLGGYVTDGPFLFRTQTGKLGMLWSSWGSTRYSQGVAYSVSGKITGPWIQEHDALVPNNSGHGMLFRTFDGKLLMSLHHQSFREANAPRRPFLLEVDDSGDKLMIRGRFNP